MAKGRNGNQADCVKLAEAPARVNNSTDRLATESLPPKPDRRVIVAALGVTRIFAWGSTFYLLGVLAIPVANDTGWALDWVMGGISIGLLIAGLISPHVGRTIGDRGGGLVLATGTGLLLLAVAQNLLRYLCAWLIVGAGMSASLYDAAFATLGSICGKEARGAITSVTLLGGFASTVCWPLSAYLVEHVGWRDTCYMLRSSSALRCRFIFLWRRADPLSGTTERARKKFRRTLSR